MASNKKPLKKYRPRPQIQDPLTYVLSGFKLPERSKTLKVQLINHGAMHSLTAGTGTRDDWQYVCNALNVAVVLAEMGIGDEYLPQIKEAMAAHAECGKRLYVHGRAVYTGPQLTAVNLGVEIHDAQLEVANVAQMEKAHIEVTRRLHAGKIEYRVKEKEPA